MIIIDRRGEQRQLAGDLGHPRRGHPVMMAAVDHGQHVNAGSKRSKGEGEIVIHRNTSYYRKAGYVKGYCELTRRPSSSTIMLAAGGDAMRRVLRQPLWNAMCAGAIVLVCAANAPAVDSPPGASSIV